MESRIDFPSVKWGPLLAGFCIGLLLPKGLRPKGRFVALVAGALAVKKILENMKPDPVICMDRPVHETSPLHKAEAAHNGRPVPVTLDSDEDVG